MSAARTSHHVEGSKQRRKKKKTNAARGPRAAFIGSRPLKVQMILRGEAVEVEVLPAVGTTTHVNLQVTISRRGKALNWVPTPAELERIGQLIGKLTERQTSH
jgi:hypothetical protein